MAIKKKIKVNKGVARAQAINVIEAGLSTTLKSTFLKEDMEIYICSGPPDVRTTSMNGWLAVVAKRIADHTGDNPLDTRKWLEKTFAPTFYTFNGESFQSSESTARMSKKRFMEFMETVCLYAWHAHGLEILLPDQVPDHVYVEHINSGLV